MTVEMRTTVFEIFLNGWGRSQIIQRTQNCMHPHTFLRSQIRNVLRKSYRNQNQSSTVVRFTSKQTEIAKSANEPRSQDSLQQTHWRSPTSSRKVWWVDNGWTQGPQWGKWITEQSPVRRRGSRSCHSMDSILSVQNKDFIGDVKECTKILRTVAKKNNSYLCGPFIGTWKILWRFIMASSRLNFLLFRDEWHRWKSRSKSKRRYFSSVVAIRIGWKMVVWFSAVLLLPSAKCPRPPGRGKTPYERRFGEPFKGPALHFGAIVDHHPISTRDLSRLYQFGKKVVPGIFLDYELILERIWKWDIMIPDVEDLEKLDASEIYLIGESTRKRYW